MMKKIRWGIMSTAHIAEARFIPAIRKTLSGEVVAVASRNYEKASNFSRKMDIPLAYGSYEELLASSEIDAIYCPLPTGMHKEWCLKSADAGKPMLCEKPLCENRADAEEVFQAFDRKNLLISESYMYLFHPRNLKVRELVRSGQIGELRSIESTFNVPMQRTNIRFSNELGGGALLDLGCYCVGISRFVAGSEPVEGKAMAYIGEQSQVDETMVGCLTFPGNVFATFSCSMISAFDCKFTVVGSEGTLNISHGGMIPWPEEQFTIELVKNGQTEIIDIPNADHYSLIAESFNLALLKGEKEVVSHSESLANLQVIDDLRNSL